MNLAFVVAIGAGIVCIAAAVVGFRGVAQHPDDDSPKVGDVWVHANPGDTPDSSHNKDPFAMIYRVEEIHGGWARCQCHSVHLDGSTKAYESWMHLDHLGDFDEFLGNYVDDTFSTPLPPPEPSENDQAFKELLRRA